MKPPLVLTLVILAAGSFWGVHETRNVAALKEKQRLVRQEAASLGISADPSQASSANKPAKRQREDSHKKVKEFTNQLVDFAKQMKETEKSGKQPDSAVQKRVMEMLDGLLSLNGEELKSLISELKARTDMDDEMRQNMISFSIMMLAQQHPETALALFTESSDMLKDNPMSNHVLAAALAQWAKDSPLAALEWIKKNAAKHPDLVKDDAKLAVITGAAQTDVKLAFQLVDELKIKAEDGALVMSMAQAANTPEQQTAFLAALRGQAARTTDKEEAAKLLSTGLAALFSRVSGGGYDQTMQWLESSDLSASEKADCAGNLNYYSVKADTGKWLDWVSSQTLDSHTAESTISHLVRPWTENDYKAAGEWLAKSPAGPNKEAAVMSYLTTVAPYDSDTAAQWAATLPAEKQQDALERIHRTLQQKDPAAAGEFAKRHGIGTK